MKKDNSKHQSSYYKIGTNIRKYRTLKGYSQEELAFQIDSARNYIGCIERGEKYPSIAILLEIATVLKCSLADLCKDA